MIALAPLSRTGLRSSSGFPSLPPLNQLWNPFLYLSLAFSSCPKDWIERRALVKNLLFILPSVEIEEPIFTPPTLLTGLLL